MWFGSMSIQQVSDLEQIFAQFTPSGWVMPAWLQFLRANVEALQE